MPIFNSGYNEKTSANADNDAFLIADSADSNVVKYSKWSTMKSAIQTFIYGLTNWVTTAMLQNNSVTTDKINANAVTTAKIANDSVTSDKIDFATLQGSPDIPTSRAINVGMGYSLNAQFTRVGNMVQVELNSTTANAIPSADGAALSEKIPVGYRPKYNTVLYGGGTVTSGAGPVNMAWRLLPTNGSMEIYNSSGMTAGPKRIMGTVTYITTDTFPS